MSAHFSAKFLKSHSWVNTRNHPKINLIHPSMSLVKSRPSAIILDLKGVIVTKEFEIYSASKKRFYHERISEFLSEESQWKKDNRGSKTDGQLKNIYRLAQTEQSRRTLKEGEPMFPRKTSQEDRENSLRQYILFCMEKNTSDVATKIFLERLQFWGYRHGYLKTPIYQEVMITLREWKVVKKIPVYLNLSSQVVFEKVTSQTDHGNLRPWFTGHLKLEWKPLISPLEKLQIRDPKTVLFVTHSATEANVASTAGLDVVMIVRPDIDPDWKERIKRGQEDDLVTTSGTGPIMVATHEGLIPVEMGIPDEREDLDSETNQGLQDFKSDHVDALFTVNSVITVQETKKFPVIESLQHLKFT